MRWILTLFACFALSASATFPGRECGLVLRTSEELAGVRVPEKLDVYFLTPRLLIGRNPTDFGEWLRIVSRDDGNLLGSIALRVHKENAHVPIYMDRFYKGLDEYVVSQPVAPRFRQGLGTEAKRALLDHVFLNLNLKAVYARILVDNAPSLAFHAKLGFVEVPRTEVPLRFQIPDDRAAGPIVYSRLDRETYFGLKP